MPMLAATALLTLCLAAIPVEFPLAAGPEWQDIRVEMPVRGALRIVRLYLPAQRSPVEIESIQYLFLDGAKVIRA